MAQLELIIVRDTMFNTQNRSMVFKIVSSRFGVQRIYRHISDSWVMSVAVLTFGFI